MMSRYDDLLPYNNKDRILEDLCPLTTNQIADVLQRHPNVPKDFVDFLQEIGAGTLGPDRYSIYNGMVDATELLGEAEIFDHLLLFGDDFSGVSHGFDTRDWQMTQIDSSSGSPTKLNMSFEAFIRNMVEAMK